MAQPYTHEWQIASIAVVSPPSSCVQSHRYTQEWRICVACRGTPSNSSPLCRLGAVQCPGRMREQFRRHILTMQVWEGDDCPVHNLASHPPSPHIQDCFSALERCRLPVIAAVQGCCVGGGVDLITACDMRICSEDATFCVKARVIISLKCGMTIFDLILLPSLGGGCWHR